MQNKTTYLLETVQQISDALKDDENIVNDLKKLIDTICHTAPEIIDSRWQKLYNYCVQFINDASEELTGLKGSSYVPLPVLGHEASGKTPMELDT